LRIDPPHPSLRLNRRIVGQGDGDYSVRGRRPQHGGRNVEHGVASILPRDLKDRLASLHHLAGLGRPGGDRAGHIGPELGESHTVLGERQLRLRVIDARRSQVER
jgi:hypothetical protein